MDQPWTPVQPQCPSYAAGVQRVVGALLLGPASGAWASYPLISGVCLPYLLAFFHVSVRPISVDLMNT